MAEESYGFSTARARLDEIVTQVRKKDTSLEKSLDLLEEGVRLANQCTELIDHVDWDAAAGIVPGGGDEQVATETEVTTDAHGADADADRDSADSRDGGAGEASGEDGDAAVADQPGGDTEESGEDFAE